MGEMSPTVIDIWGQMAEAVDDLGSQKRGEDFLAYGRRVVERISPIVNKAITAAVEAEREASRKDREIVDFILANCACSGGPGNSPCRLNESDDPGEWCLYHLAIRGRGK